MGEIFDRGKHFRRSNFALSSVYEDYVAIAGRAIVSYRKGRPAFHVENDFVLVEHLQLPLAADGGTVDMMIAITVYLTRDGREY